MIGAAILFLDHGLCYCERIINLFFSYMHLIFFYYSRYYINVLFRKNARICTYKKQFKLLARVNLFESSVLFAYFYLFAAEVSSSQRSHLCPLLCVLLCYVNLMQVSEMTQIDTNSTFFLIRSNEEIRGAWNVAHNTVKIMQLRLMHIFFVYACPLAKISVNFLTKCNINFISYSCS